MLNSGEVTNGKDPYLRELEQQISETRERRKRETTEYQDWWEKRQEPPFVVKMPTRPHPSQVRSFFLKLKSVLKIKKTVLYL